MSIAAELTKLQERKEALLNEVTQIERELESVALALGVRPKSTVIRHSTTPGVTTQRKRAERGETWRRIEFWLRAQPTAKTARDISDGAVIGLLAVQAQLVKHRSQLIHRGIRYGVFEAQFADHTAELEEERHGDETTSPSISPIAQSLNGATATSSALTTTASTAPAATARALSPRNG